MLLFLSVTRIDKLFVDDEMATEVDFLRKGFKELSIHLAILYMKTNIFFKMVVQRLEEIIILLELHLNFVVVIRPI